MHRACFFELVRVINIQKNEIFSNKFYCSYLADEIFKKPVFIYNYPKELKPFYVRVNDDGKTVAAFDVIVPKVTLEYLSQLINLSCIP